MRRVLILALAMTVMLLAGCTAAKKRDIRNNPPPIQTGGGPADPMKPQGGSAPAAPAAPEAPAEPAEGGG